MFELEGYAMPDFPERDEGQYPIAVVSLDSSGGCAYLTFADKAGYIKKLIAGDVWTGNAYTLGLTSEDTYDESKVIYEQSYVVMLDEAYKDALELLYPGITTTAWLQYKPSSKQTPSGGYYSLAMNYGPQWTNTDLYDEDGNLFLSAAGKKFPLREWLSWRIAGLCSRPLPLSKRVPVAYLYNGVRLPGLPEEWNPETHPFVYITQILGRGNYSLYFTDAPLNATYQPPGSTSSGVESLSGVNSDGISVNYQLYVYSGETECWEYRQDSTLVFSQVYVPIWANTDMEKYYFYYDSETSTGIYVATGAVGFAASAPVPVYE